MNVWKLNKENRELREQVEKLEKNLTREGRLRKSLTILYRAELRKKQWEVDKLKTDLSTFQCIFPYDI